MSSHLAALNAVKKEMGRAEEERENVISYLRYVLRKSEGSDYTEELIRGLISDIEDGKHYQTAYQR